MNNIDVLRVQINAVMEMGELAKQKINDRFQTEIDGLEKSGAHESHIRELWSLRDSVNNWVDNAQYARLKSFKLHELIPSDVARCIPVIVGESVVTLVNPVGTDYAFLLRGTHEYSSTSWKLRCAKLRFSFVCGCKNCSRVFGENAPVERVAVAAQEHDIKSVIMRHNSMWPESCARDRGVSLLEIECEQNSKKLSELKEKLKAFEGSETST